MNIFKSCTRWFRRTLDRVLQGSTLSQILFLLAINLILLILLSAFWLAQEAPLSASEARDSLWNAYNHYIDTGNQATADLARRPLAFLTSFIGSIFLGCLLISTASNIIDRRVERCRNGLVRYKQSGHYVIIGADAMLPGLVKMLFSRNSKIQVVIQTSKNVDEVRKKLFSQLPHEYEKRIYFCYARRDSEEELRSICVDKAEEVYILGDSGELDDVEYYHDSLNVDCLNLIGKILKDVKRDEPLKCYMLMEYMSTYTVFQHADVSIDSLKRIELHPFNFYETWARKVFVLNKAANNLGEKLEYRPLDYIPVTKDSDCFVHLVIVGMSRMGTALAMEAAHIAHYPNFLRDRSKRTRITFIDSHASKCMNEFKQAYTHLFEVSHSRFIDTATGKTIENDPNEKYSHLGRDFIDTEWQFVQGDIESAEVRELLTGWAEEPGALMTIAICLNLTHQSISTSMYLPDIIYKKDIPILVQQRITSAIIETLANNNINKYRNLRPFGMLCECFSLENTLLECAKRVNFIYNKINIYSDSNEEICEKITEDLTKDTDYKKDYEAQWETLKKDTFIKQWSNIYHACSLPTKIRSLGYADWKEIKALTKEEIDTVARVEHNRWDVEELLLGYRAVHEDEDDIIKDEKKKKEAKKHMIHCDIRDYEQLPENTRNYDIIASAFIPFIINGKL